jgi:hypothetical protein
MRSVLHCFDPADLRYDTLTMRRQPPHSIEELWSSTHLILAHFTSSVFLSSILEDGLLPDSGKHRAIDDGLPSDPMCVYLSSRVDRFYFRRAIEHHGGEGIVILVEVDRTSLLPDECAVGTMYATQPLDMQLYFSLCFGTCKHVGPIPTTSFLGSFSANGVALA